VPALLHSAYLAWLALVWEGLESLDQQDPESEGNLQSQAFVVELMRLRQECRSLSAATRWRFTSGLVTQPEHDRVQLLLRDLQWLLDVAPPAPPVLAKQCVRIAQDRIFDEVERLSVDGAESLAVYSSQFVATP